MKRIIILGMALVVMVVSIGGCFIPYEGRDGGGRHEEGREHEGGGEHHDRR